MLVLILAGGYGVLQFLGWLAWRPLINPEIYTFSNINKLGDEQRTRIKKFLRIEIPKSAGEIYFFRSGGKDKIKFCSFNLPPKEIDKFAKEFVGVGLSQFRNMGDYSFEFKAWGFAISGPTTWGEKWKTPHWNIEEIYERCIFFETDKKGGGRSMVVDPDTNRVYLCVH